MCQTSQQVTIEQDGRRLYVAGNSYPLKDALKGIGCKWDGERRQWWIGTAKRAELEQVVGGTDQAAAQGEDADQIRLVGKAEYKGRTYYVRAVSRDQTRARLVTLDAKLDFWATLGDGQGEARIVKRYQPREREWRGHRTTEYTTLGSIRRFIESARADERAKADGTAETRTCWECGRAFTQMDARRNGGDWQDSYCGC